MRIGIDIDDTISLTNEKMIEEAYLYDQNFVKGKGFKNKEAYSFMEMFYWSVVDVDQFLDYVRKSKMFLELEVKDGAVDAINKLYDAGNEIYFITKRSNKFRTKLMTKKWLKNNGFKYHKLILGAKNKKEVCESLNIEFFVDDNAYNIETVSELGVRSVLMASPYTEDAQDLVRLNTWSEIYDYINEVK